MKKTILTILAGTALAVGSTNAAIVFGNLGATGGNGVANSGGTILSTTSWRGMVFTPSGTDLVLNTATLGLNVSAAGSADVRVDLYTWVAIPGSDPLNGAPGVSLVSATQTLGANTLNQKIDFTLNYDLTAGTSYAIVAQKTGGDGQLRWRAPSPSVVPTGQNGSGWTFVGSQNTTPQGTDSWGILGTGGASAISLSASPIPEPGTWAAMAILAGGAAFAGWRRRQQHVA
jgi:hypothetical protein